MVGGGSLADFYFPLPDSESVIMAPYIFNARNGTAVLPAGGVRATETGLPAPLLVIPATAGIHNHMKIAEIQWISALAEMTETLMLQRPTCVRTVRDAQCGRLCGKSIYYREINYD